MPVILAITIVLVFWSVIILGIIFIIRYFINYSAKQKAKHQSNTCMNCMYYQEYIKSQKKDS